MTDTITGAINNGAVGEATIGGYTGPVGISRQEGSPTLQLAYRGAPAMKQPTTGTLDGKPIVIRSLKRSEVDRQMMVATVDLPE